MYMYIQQHISMVHVFLCTESADAPNPLLVPLEPQLVSKARRTQLWFSQAGVRGILGEGGGGEEEEEREAEEEEEVERTVRAFKEKGGKLWEREDKSKRETEVKRKREIGAGGKIDLEREMEVKRKL